MLALLTLQVDVPFYSFRGGSRNSVWGLEGNFLGNGIFYFTISNDFDAFCLYLKWRYTNDVCSFARLARL